MFKEIKNRALLGFPIGVFIGQTMLIINSILAGTGQFYPINFFTINKCGSELSAVILQYFLTGIIGASFAGSSAIFEVDSWSILRQTLTHFLINSIVMYFCGFFCNWFKHDLLNTVLWFIIFIIIYILFWAGFMLYYKIKVNKMNKEMNMNE